MKGNLHAFDNVKVPYMHKAAESVINRNSDVCKIEDLEHSNAKSNDDLEC